MSQIFGINVPELVNNKCQIPFSREKVLNCWPVLSMKQPTLDSYIISSFHSSDETNRLDKVKINNTEPCLVPFLVVKNKEAYPPTSYMPFELDTKTRSFEL